MSTSKQDQANFWTTLIQKLNSATGINQPFNTMMAGKAISCNFADNLALANQQLHDLGNCIPKWGLTWDGTYSNSFFGTYQSWLSQVHPQAEAGSNGKKDKDALDKIKGKIDDYNDCIDKIRMSQYKNFIQNNCLSPGKDGLSCKVWMPGTSMKSFNDKWKKYKQSEEYKTQIQNLEKQFGEDMAGLQEQYNGIADRLYGPNYKLLEEAQKVTDYANPKNESNPLDKKEKLNYQMVANENNKDIFVPRFYTDPSYIDYKKWLKNAQAETGTSITIEIDKSSHASDSSSYQFSGGGGFPIEEIFMIGGNVSGSHKTVHLSKYDFKMVVVYPSVTHISINPATSWYTPSMLSTYKNYDNWLPSSNFAGKTLWGPDGIFNLRVSGMFVAYNPTIKLSVSDWDKFKEDTSWSESCSFSLLGLINFGSEHAQGESHHLKVTTHDQGFDVEDISGIPKIIALTLETINY